MRNVVILGHAQHGKDTVAELVCKQLDILTYSSASLKAAVYISEAMRYLGTKYGSELECFEDRHNHRAFWGEAIALLVKDDKAKLAREVFEEGPIYCGVRRQDELDAIVEEFDPLLVWVDAGKRKPLEPTTSMQIQQTQQMIHIDNNRGPKELEEQVLILANFIAQN